MPAILAAIGITIDLGQKCGRCVELKRGAPLRLIDTATVLAIPKSAYIFSAICPEQGKAAGLVLPFYNAETMSLHLAEISLTVAPALTP